MTAFTVFSFLVALPLIVLLWWYSIYFRISIKLKDKIPRLPQLPLIGSAYHFKNTVELYSKLLQFRKDIGNKFWTMLGIEPMLLVADPYLAEAILSSPKCIDKSRTYHYLENWLGNGLLTSTGEKWKKHRKILTPAFHFKILEDFVPSFDSSSEIMVHKLYTEIGSKYTDICPYIHLSTLDAVCESAMGTTVNAQTDEGSEYVRSVRDVCRIVIDRTISWTKQFDPIYALTKDSVIEKKALKVLHDYTDSVIKRKRLMAMKDECNVDLEEKDMGIKQKLAFLDLLLQYSKGNVELSDRDIRDEVDTFMFEGHDTSSSAISFCLYCLANNPQCQEKAFAEIKKIFGSDRNRKVSFTDLHAMKYLELVLKETMRLYPPVVIYGRELKDEFAYEDMTLPKGLTIMILAYVMHRDPEHFPDPEIFDPDRFDIDNIQKRHPFCYLPFSAGPRNCIGQKFAMLSMKSTVSKILRHFELLPVEHELQLSAETILKSKTGIRVQLKKREW